MKLCKWITDTYKWDKSEKKRMKRKILRSEWLTDSLIWHADACRRKLLLFVRDAQSWICTPQRRNRWQWHLLRSCNDWYHAMKKTNLNRHSFSLPPSPFSIPARQTSPKNRENGRHESRDSKRLKKPENICRLWKLGIMLPLHIPGGNSDLSVWKILCFFYFCQLSRFPPT